MIIRLLLIVILIVFCAYARQFSISIDNLGIYTLSSEQNAHSNRTHGTIRQFDIINRNELPLNERWSLVENNRTIYHIHHDYQVYYQEWILFDVKNRLKIVKIKRRPSLTRNMYEIDSKIFGKVILRCNLNNKTYLITQFRIPIGNITQANNNKNTYFVHFETNPHSSLIVFVSLAIMLNA